MESKRTPEELPVGLMMRLTQNPRAMDGFFSLPPARQQDMLDGIRSAQTGADAKSRIESAMETLSSDVTEQFSHFDR